MSAALSEEVIKPDTINPNYHAKHGIKFTLAEKVYLARYYDIDGTKHMSLSLERPIYSLLAAIRYMRQNGEWDLYRSLSEEEYEKIILAA